MAKVYYPRCLVLIRVVLAGQASASDLHTFAATPRSCEVEHNDHRHADTFSLELDYRDFPLDPRALKAVQVAVYMADVEQPDQRLRPSDADLVFVGYADEPETSLHDGGEVVRLEGRDYTGLFLDYTWADGPLVVRRPLRRVLEGLVFAVPGAADLPIEYGAGLQGLVLAERIGRDLYSPEQNDDAWTVLVDLCAFVARTPVIEKDTLRILSAAEFLGRRRALFHYGTNVERLTYRRKLNERRSLQVRINCWDPQAGLAREAVYPASPPVVRQKISTSGQMTTERAPQVTFNWEGAYTQPELDAAAKLLWEEGAREEFEGSFTTRDLTDVSGDVRTTELRNGDIVHVRLLKDDKTALGGLSDREALVHLTSDPDALDEGTARTILAAWRRSESLSVSWYVKRVRHRWDREGGYEAGVDFIQLLEGDR